ncbi:MAG: L,D-transpeptidase [Verrucomicrobiales bacterium]|nr:L,D-transpeptidase [Verrucomicrobiales bacterium]
MLFTCVLSSCKSTFDPSTIPADKWFAQKKYSRSPKVSKAEELALSGRVHQSVLEKANGSNTRFIIDIAEQEAYLLVDGRIAVTTPVSTARPGKHTPRGTFHISERVRSGKISTIYKVAMPYWMRLDDSAVGIHAGYVPGYPASAGCVRLPYDMARVVFDNTQTGTKVSIYSDWTGN